MKTPAQASYTSSCLLNGTAQVRHRWSLSSRTSGYRPASAKSESWSIIFITASLLHPMMMDDGLQHKPYGLQHRMRQRQRAQADRKSTRLNSNHVANSYA